MSLTVDLRVPNGGTTAVTSDGQVIGLELWATVTGANGTGTDEGLQNLYGSLVSTNTSGGAALGTLKLTLTAPFNGIASTAGTQQDLDSDGDLDVGDLDPAGNSSTGLILARSDTVTTTGSPITNGQEFKVADVTFTVTGTLQFGGNTTIRWIPRNSSGINDVNAVWREDGSTKSSKSLNSTGTYLAGPGVALTRATNFISGKVFNDKNGNGAFDGKDKRIKGAQLYLDLNGDGVLTIADKSVRSTGSGLYTFWDVAPGRYKMRINTFPVGFRITKPGASYTIDMVQGGTVTGRNWGFTPLTIIPGQVFNDSNGNGVKDGAEGVWAGWRVFADLNGDGVFTLDADRGTVTDADGNFSLNSLPGGTWTLRASTPVGYTVTQPSPATPFRTVTLGNGATASAQIFGIRKVS